MRPPPRSLEEMLYRKLLDSPGFHNWVRKIHARINRIPYDPPEGHAANMKKIPFDHFQATGYQKFNAFRIIWWDELKHSFGFRRSR
jgi:hypothetical protein